MGMLSSTWAKGALIAMAILVVLNFLGGKSVHAELVIGASPQQIWDVLMNEADYEKWNQVLIPIEGEIEPGNKLKYKLVRPDGKSIEIGMRVAELIPLKLLNQSGGFPGIFTYDHRYILEDVGNGTKVIIHEDFKGIAILFWNPSWVESAYTDLTENLENHVLVGAK